VTIKYSPTEERLLELIPRDGQQVDTHVLVDQFYKNRKKPFHAYVYIGNAMRTLVKKVNRNRESFKLKRTKNERPVQYWIEGK
jgi:hypothetical protein